MLKGQSHFALVNGNIARGKGLHFSKPPPGLEQDREKGIVSCSFEGRAVNCIKLLCNWKSKIRLPTTQTLRLQY